MKGVNKIIIIGTLGGDPEVRANQNNNTVCNFNVAVNEQWRDKQGEKQERTEWIRCVVWGKLAEICGQYLTKGSQVYLEGKMQTRQWEKDGVKQYTTEVVVAEMQMLGGKSDKQDKPAPKGNKGKPDMADPADEDLPF